MLSRACGVLLHITSLPGPPDGGDLGPEARRFAELLSRTGASWWQTLPVGPPGHGGSPYDSPSAFAGSTDLVSLEDLAGPEVPAELLAEVRATSGRSARKQLLRRLYQRPETRATLDSRPFLEFCQQEQDWLDHHSTFSALSERFATQHRHEWPLDVRTRRGAAVEAARRELGSEIEFETWLQFQFERQWTELRRHAGGLGVRLIGDMPIFVSSHSADVWSHPELFELDDESLPTEVAAVPPDDFSDTGQLWGNPVYRWSEHRKDDFTWWRRRVTRSLERFDLLRIDHFRGLVANWRVKANSATAVEGRWAKAPGRRLWQAFETDGALSLTGPDGWPTLFAEDLGHITPAVRKLLDDCGLWGTRVLQFADRPESEHHPDNVDTDVVFYTGTHDNNTTRGWLDSLGDERRERLALFGVETELSTEEQVQAIARAALDAPAWLVILPFQDLLGLDSSARMNTPGTVEGNWAFQAQGTGEEEAAQISWFAQALLDARRSTGSGEGPR